MVQRRKKGRSRNNERGFPDRQGRALAFGDFANPSGLSGFALGKCLSWGKRVNPLFPRENKSVKKSPLLT
jgi:hypothetical protein